MKIFVVLLILPLLFACVAEQPLAPTDGGDDSNVKTLVYISFKPLMLYAPEGCLMTVKEPNKVKQWTRDSLVYEDPDVGTYYINMGHGEDISLSGMGIRLNGSCLVTIPIGDGYTTYEEGPYAFVIWTYQNIKILTTE